MYKLFLNICIPCFSCPKLCHSFSHSELFEIIDIIHEALWWVAWCSSKFLCSFVFCKDPVDILLSECVYVFKPDENTDWADEGCWYHFFHVKCFNRFNSVFSLDFIVNVKIRFEAKSDHIKELLWFFTFVRHSILPQYMLNEWKRI